MLTNLIKKGLEAPLYHFFWRY